MEMADKEIKDTLNDKGGIPLQSVENTDPKINENKNEVKVEDIKVNKVDETSTEIKGTETLEGNYQINKLREKSVEGRIFHIKIPDTVFKKYIKEDGVVKFPELELDFIRNRNEVFHLGKIFGINQVPSLALKSYASPSLSNVVEVKHGPTITKEAQAQANYHPNWYLNDIPNEMKYVSQMDWWLAENAIDMTDNWNYVNITSNGGSISTTHYGRKINIGTKMLKDDQLSYVTDSGAEYEQISTVKGAAKSWNEPFRFNNFRYFSTDMRKLLVWLFNLGSHSPMCYSPLVDQLKLALYCDALTTGYDNIEGLNGMMRYSYVFSGTQRIYIRVNLNEDLSAGKDVRVTWLSFRQYEDFMMNGTVSWWDEDEDERWDEKEWKFIPVKWDWIRDTDSNKMLTFLLSILPYPLCCAEYPAVRIGGSVVSIPENEVIWAGAYENVFLEHMASRVVIDGPEYVCLVIVDYPETYSDNWNDDNFPTDDFLLFTPSGESMYLHNLEHGPCDEIATHRFQVKEMLRTFLSDMTQDTNVVSLLNIYSVMTNWSTYSDLFELVAMLSTWAGKQYTNWITFSNDMPNMCLVNAVPCINTNQYDYHMEIAEPDFQQRCFAICGLVKQRGSDFIFHCSYDEFARMMYAYRLNIVSIGAYLISEKRNEVPDLVQSISGDKLPVWIEQRRRLYSNKFDSFFEYTSILNSDGLSTYGGLIKYYNPDTLIAGMRSYVNGIANIRVNVNLYYDILDWVNLFHQNIEADPYRIAELDEKMLKDNNVLVEYTQNRIILVLTKWDFKIFDNVWLSVNQTIGRTITVGNHVYETDLNSHRNTGVADARNIWEPFWKIGTLTWIADVNMRNGIDRWSWSIWPMTINGVNTYILPYIRVLDYVLPSTYWDNKTLKNIQWHTNFLKKVAPYVMTRDSHDIEWKTKIDYVNRKTVDEFKD